MKLDQDLHEVLYYRIERLMRVVKAHTRQMFREHGFKVTLDQWLTLKRISEVPGGLTQMELSHTIFKDPAAITRIIDLLEKRGLVQRQPVENDRRAYLLTLTSEGLSLVKRMTPHVQLLREKGIHHLDEHEVEMLKNLLDKMYRALES
jgi:DNA-binding MarR family transcriptional regulator